MSRCRAISLALACLIASTSCRRNEGEVTLVNRSGSTITGRELEVSGQDFIIQPMNPGGRQVIKFKVTRDSGYKVHVVFESGTELVRTLGYVTPGFDFKDELQIEHSDMVLKRTQERRKGGNEGR